MITCRDVTVIFPNGETLFEGLDFSVNYGEKIGLIGRNGSGKSTLLKLLLKKEQPSYGSIDIPDDYKIGYLDQHISFSKKTVLEEVCSILDEDREFESWKAEKILFGLGFTYEDLEKDPNKFSGGWQVKINLSKLLLSEPDMLFLDEPTNYLDIYSVRWLGDFLKKWQGELILITHDREFMSRVITHTLIIHRKAIRKFKGTPEKIKKQIEAEEEIYEKTRSAQEEKRKKTEEWIQRFKTRASTQAESKRKMLEKEEVMKKLPPMPVIDFKFSYAPLNNGHVDLVKVNNLHFGYDINNPLFANLGFNVRHGDKVCIVGKNGKGKSTLLEVIIGNLKKITGDVHLHDKAKIGYFGQMNLNRMNMNNTIYQELSSVLSGLNEQLVRRTAAQMLFRGDDAFKKISVLSGGERSRVMLGKILLSQSNLLFLDEPTNHFDIESCDALMDAIKNFEGSVLMVTHDEYFLKEIANKLIIFDNNKIICFDGTYDKFLEKVGWQELI